ncbi:MAG: hypothetical protein KKB51_17680 [Candidatus Riflebacteria bacterium]|nr:hypothetical protein [Candidatus Riflebacteria bacterium]
MLRNINFYKSSVLLALAVSLLALLTLQARNSDYLLELTIVTDRQESFELYVELTDRELTKLRNNPGIEIKPYLIEASRQHAEEIGYRRDIYGEENYKMVVITSYRFIVRDKSSGRILLSK